ncbi:MAG: GNAT family N-acetyltransferase, partial [Acidobacteriota bacterium]|nr:GNAT family N-acetyltransferase [Acidobacteriota bacterium]
MSADSFTISAASPSDREEILALLVAVGLPVEGVAEHLKGFLVARAQGGRLVGCAGVERHGESGLLRSVVVAPDRQRSGLGSRLVSAALSAAERGGVKEVVLLTTTARDFFAAHSGFEEATRADYEKQFAA